MIQLGVKSFSHYHLHIYHDLKLGHEDLECFFYLNIFGLSSKKIHYTSIYVIDLTTDTDTLEINM